MAIAKQEIRNVFNKLVKFAADQKASDIFINTEQCVSVKVDGKLNPIKQLFMEKEDIFNLIQEVSRKEAYEAFLNTNELNMMVEVPDVTYLRVNGYMQRNMPGLVMRLIPSNIPRLDDLHLPQPDVLRRLALVRRGLIIIVGATGNGKSTTLASMIDYRNEERYDHIITVEDPIEFMHKNKNSVVIQREVGIDTDSYGTALKNSLRQAPDVILIGEIRDIDTMQYAMHFAETGHLCLATLHATNSVQALDRIYNFFPRDQRKALQAELANNLVCLITQRLLPKSDGSGRVVAMEMMYKSPYIESLVADGDLEKIPEAIERGRPEEGLMTFDRCIFDLYEEGMISYNDALEFVESQNNFRIRIRTQSKRRLPTELQGSGDIYAVQSEDALEREIMRKDREERERQRREGTKRSIGT